MYLLQGNLPKEDLGQVDYVMVKWNEIVCVLMGRLDSIRSDFMMYLIRIVFMCVNNVESSHPITTRKTFICVEHAEIPHRFRM